MLIQYNMLSISLFKNITGCDWMATNYIYFKAQKARKILSKYTSNFLHQIYFNLDFQIFILIFFPRKKIVPIRQKFYIRKVC